MSYRFKLEVLGNQGLVIKQELKMELVPYEIITPSTTRGIIEVIYLILNIMMLIHI